MEKLCPIGMCKQCKQIVYVTEQKVNVNGFYYHYECYKLMEEKK